MKKIYNYINGELLAPNSGNYLDNVSPVNGQVYSYVPDSDAQDVEVAIQAAKEAFPSWSGLSKQDRYEHLMRLSEGIKNRFEELVAAESYDNGKPEWLARLVDIPRASTNIEFFATASLHYASELHDMDGNALNYTLRKPVGVVGCISPWNLPIYLLTWKIAPALAAGNTVVAKPSEVTPMTAHILGEICQEVGFPKGVLNIVHGLGHKVGDAITRHPDTPIISFTGGTVTGAKIAEVAAPMFKKLSLELGGKNPNIVFADADFDLALEMAVKASFSNQGQICLCGSRLFVERPIYAKFKAAFVEKTKALKVGNPKEADSNLGAVVSESHMNNILNRIEQAKQEGGTVLCGGERVILEGDLETGFYVAPTIIEGLDYMCQTNQEEIFGPVVTITPFDSEQEVLEMANSTKYGLAGSVFTQDISKGHRVAGAIDSGVVWINTWLLRDLRIPFGGMKNSGVGREGGFKSLQFFTEEKNVCLKL
ncbi:MAG: 2-hydroxymuconic semialdehyde dehydrogenase [Flavobacteriales bacterium]|nr:2-hydroxymuconic semialdehyde dehydrogenase [Flavobacteriales bacterium]|tara:strand:- start:3987 stop:5429 length:1443 start_codon:yes stop_codon:yes gene_type:complete